jgi:hypothetical protein
MFFVLGAIVAALMPQAVPCSRTMAAWPWPRHSTKDQCADFAASKAQAKKKAAPDGRPWKVWERMPERHALLYVAAQTGKCVI